jgi:hypothetical protein
MAKNTSPIPDQILADILWSFDGSPFDDVREFAEEVGRYQVEISGDHSWAPDEVVLPVQEVVIDFPDEDDDGSDGPAAVHFLSDDGKGFTAGELLFKIHNAFVERAVDTDHYFFEGLALVSNVSGKPPVYRLNTGS